MPRRQRKAPEKNWTMLAYIAGDNNLSDFGLLDVSEMEKTGTSPRVYAGVEMDTEGEHDGSIRYEISEPDWTGKSHRTVIERLPERNTGSPAVLRSFVRWGLNRYHSKNTLLVVWGHGAGFKLPKRDVAFDDFGDSLSMPEIDSVLRGTGFKDGKKLAILGFDACLMCMLEVAHHLSERAEYLVGSQQTEPGDGWPYSAVLGALNRTASPAHVAVAIVEAYQKWYRGKDMSVTQAAIRLENTPAAVEAWNHLGTLLAKYLPAPHAKTQIRRIRRATQSYEYDDYVDLIHFTQLLARAKLNPQITAAAHDAGKAADDCILKSISIGSDVAHSNGLSMWFPTESSTFNQARAKYVALKCNRPRTGWLRFLDEYHG